MSERFRLARASELQPDLAVSDESSKKGKASRARKLALKRVVANMTISNMEMLQLFPEIIQCMSLNDVEIKRMCFLYLETYAKVRPQQANEALAVLTRELSNPQTPSLVRGLALRTLSSVPAKSYVRETIKYVRKCLSDADPYVRKSTALAIAKAWSSEPEATEAAGLIGSLNKMLVTDASPIVVSAAIEALLEITSTSPKLDLVIDRRTTVTLARILPECTEWAKAAILVALLHFVPQSSQEAEEIVGLVAPQAQHSNSAVVLGVARLVLYLSNYCSTVDFKRLVASPLLSQLALRPPEIQYVVLRNVLLLTQNYPELFIGELKHFYYSSSDPEYVKIVKIQILCELTSEDSYRDVLDELKEVARSASSAGEKPVRRAVSAIGRVAVRIDNSVPQCMSLLRQLLASSQVYVVQEAVDALVHIMRRYPERWSEYANTVDMVWALDRRTYINRNDSARSAYIWLVGHFARSFPHPKELFEELIEEWADLSIAVQLSALTAAARIYASLPSEVTRSFVPKLFERAVDTASDPDLRDRAMMYYRLFTVSEQRADPIVFRSVVTVREPATDIDEALLEETALEELQLSLGYLSSVYLKPAAQLFRIAKPLSVGQSPALLPRRRKPSRAGDASPALSQLSSTFSDMHVSHQSMAPPPSGLVPPRPPQPRMGRSNSVLYQQPMLTGRQTLNSVDETSAIFEEDERLIDI